MEKKYLNEAIIGNDNIVATYSYKGELLRLLYPNRDFKQFIDKMNTGVKINDSRIIYLHDDINNIYNQYYTPNTNVLNTQIENTYFNLKINQTDFVSTTKDIIVKRYTFTNNNTIDLDINFLIESKLLSNFNNMVGTKMQDDVFLQYNHDYTMATFSNCKIQSYKLYNEKESFESGILHDKDYIGMSCDSAISYKIGTLKPGESSNIDICIQLKHNRKVRHMDDIIEEANEIKQLDIEKELENTKKYWCNFVKKHDGLQIIKDDKKLKDIFDEDTVGKIKNIYIRTILLFPLLENDKTGGIVAAMEVDEKQELSGRYNYCWPRDALFVTNALDILKMTEETEKFYKKFARETQSQNGMWEQRFYTDGTLAPCWGYQIDETASIVYGIYSHYCINKQNKEFLKSTLQMCENAIDSLKEYIDIKIDKKESSSNKTYENYESYDLWENKEAIHLYSMAAIYAAFNSMINIYQELTLKNQNLNKKKIEEIEEYIEKVKKYVIENLTNNETSTLKRNNIDDLADISVIGAITPFKMFKPDKKQVVNTIEKINMTLRTYTSGYIRYQEDNYLQGNNPWPIATLWMAQYNMSINNKEEVKKAIEFVTNTATQHGFLAEQIDNNTMQPKWVIGLGWSHAMYIETLQAILSH